MAGLRNHYQVAQALGSDRFAAMMAAYCMQKASCVVVSAGTAVTIDALSVHGTQADFLGGWILPGLHLMQQSLTQAAAQLPETSFSSKPAEQTKFARNTEDAMQFGALNAVVGAIKEMSAALTANDNKPPHIIISGGDAALIKIGLAVTTPCSIVDNLVLHGLYFMDRNLQSESQ
jgi:type III pantothenate kinase